MPLEFLSIKRYYKPYLRVRNNGMSLTRAQFICYSENSVNSQSMVSLATFLFVRQRNSILSCSYKVSNIKTIHDIIHWNRLGCQYPILIRIRRCLDLFVFISCFGVKLTTNEIPWKGTSRIIIWTDQSPTSQPNNGYRKGSTHWFVCLIGQYI